MCNPDPGSSHRRELIERVPLFGGLPQDVHRERVEAHAQLGHVSRSVTIVIGENEKGNALYIIMHGTVDVVRGTNDDETHLARLTKGEFFGERALLGDDVRTATVKAATPLTLLRVARPSVLALADEHREIADRLTRAAEARA